MRKYYIFISILTAVVFFLLGITFVLGGTPISERDLTYDSKRISDFYAIQTAIQNYYSSQGKIPASISELVPEQLPTIPKDPQTQKDYEFVPKSGLKYSLCAVFSTDSITSDQNSYKPYGTSNKHKKGHDCLEFTASPVTNNFSNSGGSFDKLIGKQYFFVQTDVEWTPKAPSPNEFEGILIFNDLELSLSGVSLYEVKNNPNEYFLVLQVMVNSKPETCKGPSSNLVSCTYQYSYLNLHSPTGGTFKKNLIGTKEHIDVLPLWDKIPEVINFSNDKKEYFGAIGYFVPKSVLEIQKKAVLQLSYDAGKFASSKEPLNISITVK